MFKKKQKKENEKKNRQVRTEMRKREKISKNPFDVLKNIKMADFGKE